MRILSFASRIIIFYIYYFFLTFRHKTVNFFYLYLKIFEKTIKSVVQIDNLYKNSTKYRLSCSFGIYKIIIMLYMKFSYLNLLNLLISTDFIFYHLNLTFYNIFGN